MSPGTAAAATVGTRCATSSFRRFTVPEIVTPLSCYCPVVGSPKARVVEASVSCVVAYDCKLPPTPGIASRHRHWVVRHVHIRLPDADVLRVIGDANRIEGADDGHRINVLAFLWHAHWFMSLILCAATSRSSSSLLLLLLLPPVLSPPFSLAPRRQQGVAPRIWR
uniref:Uncharacterized protein n=1 Tax=Oryza rufipogon TaxID=4529 RepID=A0A0E0QCD3_ORYRU